MRQTLRPASPFVTLPAIGCLLAACQGLPPPAPGSATGIEIHIAHINDHHSNLEPQPDFELRLDGVSCGSTACRHASPPVAFHA